MSEGGEIDFQCRKIADCRDYLSVALYAASVVCVNDEVRSSYHKPGCLVLFERYMKD